MNTYLVIAVSLLSMSALSACGGAKTTEKGPELDAELACGFERVRPTTTAPSSPPVCEVDSSSKLYEISVNVSTTDGEEVTEGQETKREKFPSKEPSVKLDLDGQPVTLPPLVARGSTWGTPDFTLPETSRGKTLTAKIESTDSRGLKSNSIELKILLK